MVSFNFKPATSVIFAFFLSCSFPYLHSDSDFDFSNSNNSEITSSDPAFASSTSIPETTIEEITFSVSEHENSTGSNAPTESTPLAVSSTETVPTTSLPTKASPITSSLSFCPCDYHLNSCDFNCCCDLDCSEKAKAVFSTCVDEETFQKFSASRDARRCYKRDFIFRNRTMFKTETSQNGLFCIVSDNANKEEVFPPPKVNLNRVSRESKPRYFWKHVAGSDDFSSSQHSYKFGDQIRLVKFNENDAELSEKDFGMAMPSPAFGSKCTARTPVNFLQDTETLCHVEVQDLARQCTTLDTLDVKNFLKDLYVIANPSLNISKENLVEFTYLPCPAPISLPSSTVCVRTATLLYPSYTNGTCINVLQELQIVFKHRGIEGIVHVIAHISYLNYSSTTTKIFQKFSTMYEWEDPKEDNDHPHLSRPPSAYPGYSIGKKVLIGRSVRILNERHANNKTVKDKRSLVTLENRELVIDPYSVQPLTTFSPHYCDEGERKPLLFGYDLSVNCLVDYSNITSCKNLQAKVGILLHGMSPKNLSQMYVAAIGNPDFVISSHWVPFIISEDLFTVTDSQESISNGCDGIVTSISFHFLYAKVGSIHFPQLNIMGILIEYGQSAILPAQANESPTSIFLTTIAKFIDVTPPPVTPLPKWPIISIRLPPDFFYPFSVATSGTPVAVSQFYTLIILIMIMIV